MDLLEVLYEKLDYGYEVDGDDQQDDSIERVMKIQIEAFSADNGQIESLLAAGRVALSAHLRKKEEEERAHREKLAAEAAAREAEERKKREEATAELVKKLQEHLRQMNSSINESADLNSTFGGFPFDLSAFGDEVLNDQHLGHIPKQNLATEQASATEAPSLDENIFGEEQQGETSPLHDEV